MFSPLFYTVCTVYPDVLMIHFFAKNVFSKAVLTHQMHFTYVVYFHSLHMQGFDRRHSSSRKSLRCKFFQDTTQETLSGIISGLRLLFRTDVTRTNRSRAKN